MMGTLREAIKSMSAEAEFEQCRKNCARLRAEVAELVGALAPFARIVRSTLYGPDDDEAYDAVLSNTIEAVAFGAVTSRDFTGQDIARAAAVLAKHPTAKEQG
ncbi:MAG: hypothetical protein Q7S17_06535 [Xanthobacteraceae bacterium]|nr:hypothetical protein [Xanthobacteraceae bacterium]